MGLFSDSPGAVYPALKRLAMRGWTTTGQASGARNTRLIRLTPEGRASVSAWLAQPAPEGLIEKRPEIVELRFVLASNLLGADVARADLSDAVIRLDRQLTSLDAYIAGPGAGLSEASRQALRLGRSLCTTRLEWCRERLEPKTG